MTQFDLLLDDDHRHGGIGGWPAVFVCRHIAAGTARGFHRDPDDDDPWPDAWCDACDSALGKSGGWTAETFMAKMTTICGECYDCAREKDDVRPSMSEDEIEQLLRDASANSAALVESLQRDFRVNTHARWRWEPPDGTFWFENKAGEPRVRGNFLFAGTYARNEGSWLWSWANPSLERELTIPLIAVKRFGEEHRIDWLARAYRECDESGAAQLLAVAAMLLGADGIYRVPQDDVYVYLLLENLRWVE